MKMIIFMYQLLSYLQQEYAISAVSGFLSDKVTPKVSSDEHFFCGGLIGAACIQALVVWHGDLWRQTPTPHWVVHAISLTTRMPELPPRPRHQC